jgi:hypothetical protein
VESEKAAAAKRAPISDAAVVRPAKPSIAGHRGAQTHRGRRSRDLTLHDAALHHQQVIRGSAPAMELPKRG